jgi:peptide/nickel transport system permease protein
MTRLKAAVGTLRRYPTSILSLTIITTLVVISIVTLITIPLNEARDLWRTSSLAWEEWPKRAQPAWTNVFRSAENKLPETIIIETQESETLSVESLGRAGVAKRVTREMTFDYTYNIHPSELALIFTTEYASSAPMAVITWITPDGREFEVFNSVINKRRHVISTDSKLTRKLGGAQPIFGLFSRPEDTMSELTADNAVVQKGTYTLRLVTTTFEENSTADAKAIVYGRVAGIAGTDHYRRHLLIGLLWGTPVALMFGLLAAVGSTCLTFIIAAIGVWFGGWVDSLIQRITEVNLMLPLLPILIMLGIFYSPNIMLTLGAVILLNIFSTAIKTYRAIFLQVKNAPFIEAARAYGASGFRIIFRYMIPKVAPILIPAFVTLTPTYVFLEAALAFLGVGDIQLPTWGKILNNANTEGALFQGQFYWVLEPAFMLLTTGLAFSMLGFALDRIFNPRLRGI